jgi:hypothetical protein
MFLADQHAPEVAADPYELNGPREAAQYAMFWALWYTGYLVAGAIGAATSMRVRGQHRARASLVARDVTTCVPPVCVRTTFILGPIALLGAALILVSGAPDWYDRIYLGIALAVAIVAMVVMIPLANRLAQMAMPVDTDRDPALDAALRHVSARMVAGDALFMVAAAFAVVAALVMPSFETAFAVVFAVMLPGSVASYALQPGEVVPRYLVRWLDAPQRSGAQ